MRAFPGGGAPKPPQLHYDMKEAFDGAGIVAGYGSTETGILTMASVHDSDDDLANTEGPALPGVELKLVTLDGEVAGPGEEGEIRVRGAAADEGLPRRRRSTPTPSTTRATSGPATSASSNERGHAA